LITAVFVIPGEVFMASSSAASSMLRVVLMRAS
jgi:hypothetical protein